MNELANMIRDYIHECFDNSDYIPSDDEVYMKFIEHQPSEHIIEMEINSFFDGHYILPSTKIKYEGRIKPQVQIEMEDAI